MPHLFDDQGWVSLGLRRLFGRCIHLFHRRLCHAAEEAKALEPRLARHDLVLHGLLGPGKARGCHGLGKHSGIEDVAGV